MNKTCFSLFGAMLACAAPAWAQTPTASFPFVLPWDDSTPGTITDVSFLNARPAGVNGYIVAKNGHFVESVTGHRMRFLGTNFAAKAAFPSHADAEKVAARIAKLGINLVRMHHMDNDDWGQDESIWDYGYKDRQHISAAQRDKLDYLIAQFKKNGVYVNLNLHVSRQFTEADGFPASVSHIQTSYDKRVDEFDGRMIALQKNYARALLTHVNPYTHLTYAADPAVAVIEINNENSLVGDPWATYGDSLDTLPEPFRGELAGKWNDWLLKKYGTDTKLSAAWTAGLTPKGPSVNTQAAWSVEAQGTSKIAVTPLPGAKTADLQAAVPQVDGTDWHVQAHQTGLDLHDDMTYTVTFRAKADAARTLPVVASLDQNNWHNVGLDTTAALTTDWKTFQYTFTAHDTVPQHNRLAFTLGGQTGIVWISDLQIHPGTDKAGLQPGQSLTTKTVDIPTAALKTQAGDWVTFLADTERDYAETMRGYLKDTLKVHANIICSQISWGGLTGMNRESHMDFADNHNYWQHPSFPHKPWDSVDWNITNTPMAADLATGGGGTLRPLAEYRVAGKPYTVSEYNHPAPNDYRAEMMPEYASFAAFQDWDAIYLFDYGAYGTSADNEKINSYFGISSDPTKTAFLPASALIFRAGLLPPAAALSSRSAGPAGLKAGLAQGVLTADQLWQKTPPKIFEARIVFSPAAAPAAPVLASTTVHSAANAIQVSGTAASALYRADSQSCAALAGYVGGTAVRLKTGTLTFPAFGNNFAAVTLTAMDRKPVTVSQRLLLTLVGKVENQGMGWNAARTSVGDQWGTGPTVAEGIPATVTLTTSGPRAVWALDGTGKHLQKVPASYASGTVTFTVGPQYKTLWYAVER